MWLIIGMREKDEDGAPLFWSNEDGWVDIGSAARFTLEEMTRVRLPVGGAWISEASVGEPAGA